MSKYKCLFKVSIILSSVYGEWVERENDPRLQSCKQCQLRDHDYVIIIDFRYKIRLKESKKWLKEKDRSQGRSCGVTHINSTEELETEETAQDQ